MGDGFSAQILLGHWGKHIIRASVNNMPHSLCRTSSSRIRLCFSSVPVYFLLFQDIAATTGRPINPAWADVLAHLPPIPTTTYKNTIVLGMWESSFVATLRCIVLVIETSFLRLQQLHMAIRTGPTWVARQTTSSPSGRGP